MFTLVSANDALVGRQLQPSIQARLMCSSSPTGAAADSPKHAAASNSKYRMNSKAAKPEIVIEREK
jgi:hypothetical protein